MTNDAKLTLTPKLRFPEFRGAPGWEATSGDELFEQINNRQAPTGLPILAITQEHGAIPRDAIDYHVSVTDKSVETYKEVLPGDFIISLRSFQGGIEYSAYHGICSPAYVILRKKTEIVDVFFKQLFKSYSFIQQLTKNLEGLRDGKMISYRQFSELLLAAPTPAEQHKIASCLSSLDELIGGESLKLDALKAHKKGLMQQLFSREGETLPRLRFPEFRNAPEWAKKSMGRVVTPIVREIDKPATAYTGLGIRSHGKGTFLKMSENPEKNSMEVLYEVKPDDLILNITFAWEGAIAIAQECDDGALVSHRFPTYTINRDESIPEFLRYVILDKQFVYNLGVISPGGAGRNRVLNKNDFLKLSILLPEIEEQQRISSCLSSLGDLIAAQSDQVEALKTHKRGLMQQLFPSLEED